MKKKEHAFVNLENLVTTAKVSENVYQRLESIARKGLYLKNICSTTNKFYIMS